MVYGVDNSLWFEDFCKNFCVEIVFLNEEDIEFDIVGIDVVIVNVFWRIFIVEVLFISFLLFEYEVLVVLFINWFF